MRVPASSTAAGKGAEMLIKVVASESLLDIFSRCWAVLYEALIAAAMSMVCGMGLLVHLDENRRGRQPLTPPKTLVPAQRRGTEWERIPPRRG